MSSYSESWLAGPQKTQFYSRTYTSPSPSALVIFVHGFIDHVRRYEEFHSALAAQGVTVFAFDQRGFGRTALDEKHKKNSDYGKTSWREQMEDIQWAVEHAKSCFDDLPAFLLGQSMGGGLCLAFATRPNPPPSPETVSGLSGVIVMSPLLEQTTPVSRLILWAGTKASYLVPYLTIPAGVTQEDISHDPSVVEAAKKDPLIKYRGSLAGVRDMLSGGKQLVKSDYQRWPKSLPILILHGTEDRVTSHKASEIFFNNLSVEDKKLSLYPGGYHELHTEPDGVKEKFTSECVEWIKSHLVKHGTTPNAKL